MDKPKMRQLIIETDVDKLVNILARTGKVKMTTAAKRIGVKSTQIEEWGKVLEEHGLVKLVYPLVGEPRIEVVKVLPVEKKAAEFEGRHEQIKERAKEFDNKVAAVQQTVHISEGNFKELDKELRERLGDAERRIKRLGEIREMKKSLDDDVAHWEETGKRIADQSSHVHSSSKELSADITDMQNIMNTIDGTITKTLTFCEQHSGQIANLTDEKKAIEEEIAILDKEVRMVAALTHHPFKIPMFTGLKRMLKSDKKKLDKAEKHKEKLHHEAKSLEKKVKEPHKPEKKHHKRR